MQFITIVEIMKVQKQKKVTHVGTSVSGAAGGESQASGAGAFGVVPVGAARCQKIYPVTGVQSKGVNQI